MSSCCGAPAANAAAFMMGVKISTALKPQQVLAHSINLGSLQSLVHPIHALRNPVGKQNHNVAHVERTTTLLVGCIS
jgi:hypothetical protein